MHEWSKLTLIAALLAYVPSLNAQQVRAGIKVGGQITDALSAAPAVVPPSPDFNHFTWGPVAEVILTHGLGLEFGAFHKHYAYSFLIIGPYIIR